MQYTPGDVRKNSYTTFSYGPLHMDVQMLVDQLEHIQWLCLDTGCCQEDLPKVMSDGEELRERVREIHAVI